MLNFLQAHFDAMDHTSGPRTRRVAPRGGSSLQGAGKALQEALMKDRVEYKRSKEIPGLVLSEARFSEFRFERHYHLDYHIALVTEGVQRQDSMAKRCYSRRAASS
jgi:hypothetical protein